MKVAALKDLRDSGSVQGPGLVYYHGDALDAGLTAIAQAKGKE